MGEKKGRNANPRRAKKLKMPKTLRGTPVIKDFDDPAIKDFKDFDDKVRKALEYPSGGLKSMPPKKMSSGGLTGKCRGGGAASKGTRFIGVK